MKINKTTVINIILSYIFLAVISLLRQLCLYLYPDKVCINFFVYVGYITLLSLWTYSIKIRISQKRFRIYLSLEAFVMFFWISIRCLQETVFINNPVLMRVSGYYIVIPIVLIPLLGLFGIIEMDKGLGYKFPKKWYFLLIPAAVFIGLMITNDYHCFVFKPYSHDNPRLFIPNIGLFIIAAWAVTIEVSRIIILLKKSKHNTDYKYLRYLPFAWIAIMVIFAIPYLLKFFSVDFEILEFTAKQFFLEILLWEVCIMLGMLPVNSQYKQVFECSTVAMRIVNESGDTVFASSKAYYISKRQFANLKKNRELYIGDGQYLLIHKIPNGYLIWQQDSSEIRRFLKEIQKNSKMIEHEVVLLNEEVRIKSEAARIQTKNKIYNQLTERVGDKLDLIEEIISNADGSTNKEKCLQEVLLIGTYIKRYCNLVLTLEETGTITLNDLVFSLNDIIKCIIKFGIDVSFNVDSKITPTPDFSLFITEAFGGLLYNARHNIDFVSLDITNKAVFRIDFAHPASITDDEKDEFNKNGFKTTYTAEPSGCVLEIEESES